MACGREVEEGKRVRRRRPEDLEWVSGLEGRAQHVISSDCDSID